MRRSALALASGVAAAVCAMALAAAPSVAAGSLPTLTIAITPHSIVVGGARVSGAVNIVSTVTGEATDAPTLILLRPGVTPQAFGKAAAHLSMSTPLDAIDPYGSIVFDGVAVAGRPSDAQTWLPPGTYVALNNENGSSVFTVAPSAHPALLPAPAAEIDAIDFGFHGADVLHDGELLRVKNDGYLIHMFLFAQARSLADARKAEVALRNGTIQKYAHQYGTGLMGGFAGPLSHAELQQEVVTEPPGIYVIYCGMNAEDGREHYELGMYKIIRIEK